ncbi:MAG: asparagine synthase-related protein [Blastocatellia bacterium]|nr:asparagine synthase-related protein [Blastocatellia bacterium]
MLEGIERLVSLVDTQATALTGCTLKEIDEAVRGCDLSALSRTDGHFAAVRREGRTVRMARTMGIPLRYLVAKMHHGPFLVVGQRLDQIFEWCREQRIGWQFDPAYTRMVPAHYLVEIDQIGCPDPAPRLHRFFNPPIGMGSEDLEEAGARYIRATYQALKNRLAAIPDPEPIALAFSGGIDSTAIFLLARKALAELGSDPDRLRAFTLDLGAGEDAKQAAEVVRKLGLEENWEIIQAPAESLSLEEAIRVIEDYHPLDVECAAVALCLLEGIRERYPSLKYLLDGDGGDENLKSYPLEDSDLTISSVLRNPLLYQEGWGVDAIKHSQTYSGGLSRAYVRTYAPALRCGFEAFSPYTVRSVIAEALAIPFERVIGDSAERLSALKQDVVGVGVKAVTGIAMPTHPKRRFQDGAGGESYRTWRVSKSWCRQVFLRQWQERLQAAWDPASARRSGNEMTMPKATLIQS